MKVCSSPSSDQEESTVHQSESADTSEDMSTPEHFSTDLSNANGCFLTSLLQISREELIRAQ